MVEDKNSKHLTDLVGWASALPLCDCKTKETAKGRKRITTCLWGVIWGHEALAGEDNNMGRCLLKCGYPARKSLSLKKVKMGAGQISRRKATMKKRDKATRLNLCWHCLKNQREDGLSTCRKCREKYRKKR